MFSWKKSEKTTKNSVAVSKGFPARVKISSAHVIASLIPAASKPLIMKSFWCLRWLHVLKIHQAWRGFKSLNLRDTLTLPGATPFDNCLLTLSAYQALKFFQINFFADWLMLRLKGCGHFLVRLRRTITNSQLFFEHNRFISLLSWPLKVSINIKECRSSW